MHMPSRPIVVIKCGDHLVQGWVENMTPLLPEYEVVPYNSTFAPELVAYVIGWRPDARWINMFPNLKAVVSIGSGVDHIAHLEELRPGIPLIRTVSPDLIQRMREFVLLCVLAWHRQFPAILENRHTAVWNRYAADTADSISVGIMGFGSMGRAVAEVLRYVGYSVSIWASSPRTDIEFLYFHGSAELHEFAAKNDVIVCLLPLTSATANIIDFAFLKCIRRGGCLINVGRGGHLVDADLLRALDEGHLTAAFLDVFREEPLPRTSPLWAAGKVFVTCHSASYISPEAGPRIIAANIQRFDKGLPVSPMYRPELGY